MLARKRIIHWFIRRLSACAGSVPRTPATIWLVFVASTILSLQTSRSFAEEGARIDYFSDVKPILKERCFSCHGALKREAELRLDSIANILAGGSSGMVVVPRSPGESPLVQRITANEQSDRMPPEGAPLTTAQIASIQGWIRSGAVVNGNDDPERDPRDHWAFQPVRNPVIPRSHDLRHTSASRASNPIDYFLLQSQIGQQVDLLRRADKRLLARRVYVDLLGVPPTLDEQEAFLNDPAPDAYVRLVDRLLARPEYGQRWGRHWMDVWRYSDWYGLGEQLRNSQRYMWRWRDWIINALNMNRRYDQLVIEMLAGDELEPCNPDVIQGTGYLARNYYLFNRTTWLDSTIEHTSKAFLGLTVNCAKCHDHKYDPITHEDYYAMRAIFEPHQVRVDAVATQPDLGLDGYPRVFDGHPNAVTYVHLRGDPKQPDIENPVGPAIPRFLNSVPFNPQSIELPISAQNPGLREPLRRAHVAALHRQVDEAAARLQPENQKTSTSDAPRISRDVLALQHKVAQLRLASVVAAYDMHLAQSAIEQETTRQDITRPLDELKRLASGKKRELDLAEAELALLELESTVQARHPSETPVNGANPQENDLDDIKKDIEAAKSRVDTARSQLSTPVEQISLPRSSVKAPEGPDDTDASQQAVYPKTTTGRRLAFARWIVHPDNPLTARVAVNHIWLRHFGRPLVEPVNDFGRRTKKPRQAKLLDWLATEFVASHWDMKQLHRCIVTSEIYQLMTADKHVDPAIRKRDPTNQLYWCWTPVRMESQVLRDSLLRLADALDVRLGGPSVSAESDLPPFRRSVYFKHSRDDQHQFLQMFDDADIFRCYRRQSTIIPQQALAMMNNQLTIKLSPMISQSFVRKRNDVRDEDFVRMSFRGILCREPTDAETKTCISAIDNWRDAASAETMTTSSYATLVRVLLNHNDFITVR